MDLIQVSTFFVEVTFDAAGPHIKASYRTYSVGLARLATCSLRAVDINVPNEHLTVECTRSCVLILCEQSNATPCGKCAHVERRRMPPEASSQTNDYEPPAPPPRHS